MIKHKRGKANVVAYAFSRWNVLLSTFETIFVSLEHINELYESDLRFYSKFLAYEQDAYNWYFRHIDY